MKLLLLACALVLAGGYLPRCAAAPLEEDKVCQPHSRPWQVYLRGDGVSCSGALVDQWWVVIPFHCAPWGSYNIVAYLGEQDLTVEEGTEQRIHIVDVVRHSPYRSPLHSLAMVRLASPARFNQYVQPIPLPSSCPKPGDSCQVSGWGSTTPHQYEPFQRLKCITVSVVDDRTCEKGLDDYIYWSYGMVCAGQAHTDNCLEDSGSVMVCGGQLQGVKWFNNGCKDPARPTVYSKMCRYTDWIRRVMSSFSPTTMPPWITKMKKAD